MLCWLLLLVWLLLLQLVDSTWNRIKGFAAQDNTIWKAGDGTRGYTQIATEFIPIRSKQLLQVGHKPWHNRALQVGPCFWSRGSVRRCSLSSTQPHTLLG